MSKSAIGAFLTQVAGSAYAANLQADASAQTNPVEWLVETAAKQGFQFTVKEFPEVQDEALAVMSDKDLEAVAGGITTDVHWTRPTLQSMDLLKLAPFCKKCAGM